MTELLMLILGFVFLSGVLSLVDAAILSVERAEIEEMIVQKKWGALPLRWVSEHLTKAVVVIVIATNIVNVLGPILVGQKAIVLYGSGIIGIITGVLTFCTIIFSEIIPKSLGAHYAPTISRTVSPVIVAFVWLLYPVVYALEKVAGIFKSGKRAIGTEQQIRSLVSLGHSAGHIELDERQLIHRAFVLNDRLAKDVMKPRDTIVAIEGKASIREAAQTVFEHSYSRYPVYDGTLDTILGIAMSMDILEALANGRDNDPVSLLVREAIIIPEHKRCDDLLALFRTKHVHLAIVRDSGKTTGLVTLEDVLEELVGEIEDEADSEEAQAISS